MKRSFLVAVFFCHLALVIAGAAHLTPRVKGAVGRALRFYDALSGAGDAYSFFAPTVGPQLRARFILTGPQGARTEETLETGKGREVGLRLGNLAGTVFIVSRRTDMRRAFLGALAAGRLRAHPRVCVGGGLQPAREDDLGRARRPRRSAGDARHPRGGTAQ